MQIVRTAVWIVVTAILVAFMAMNWRHAPVNFWPLDGGDYLHFEWPVGIIALFFFALGLGPMWLLHRAGQWRLQRRISSLENSVRTTAIAAPATTAVAAPTEPEAAPTPAEEEKTAN